MIPAIDYCEQASAGSQLLNSVSNIAFLIAAAALYMHFKKEQRMDARSYLLLSLTVLMGIGSFSWHFHKSQITFVFDMLPIAMFILSCTYFISLDVTRSIRKSLLVIAAYALSLTATLAITWPATGKSTLNAAFAHTLVVACAAVTWIHYSAKRKELAKKLFYALISFACALAAWQADMLLCSYFRIGTHFVWHVLVAVMVYTLVKGMHDKKKVFV